MNREQRREKDKSLNQELKREKQLRKWIKSLNSNQRNMINDYSEIIFKERFHNVTEAMDRSMTAAMINNTNFSMIEINKIFKESYDLIEEDTQKVKGLKAECGGDLYMALSKYEPEVSKKAMEYVKEGIKQKQAIENLVLDFPKLSKSMLTNAYKKNKEIYAEVEKAKAADRILKIIEEPKKEVKEEIKQEEVKEDIKTEEKKEINKMSNLKVKEIVLEGNNGTYVAKEGKVTLENIKELEFNNLEELNNWTNEVKEVFERIK